MTRPLVTGRRDGDDLVMALPQLGAGRTAPTCRAGPRRACGRRRPARSTSNGCAIAGADLIGAAGDYRRQPAFSGGGLAVLRRAARRRRAPGRPFPPGARRAVGRGRRPLPAPARSPPAPSAAETAALWIGKAARMVAAEARPGAEIVAYVGLTRLVTERAGLDVMEAVHRGLGLAVVHPAPSGRAGRRATSRPTCASPRPTAPWRMRPRPCSASRRRPASSVETRHERGRLSRRARAAAVGRSRRSRRRRAFPGPVAPSRRRDAGLRRPAGAVRTARGSGPRADPHRRGGLASRARSPSRRPGSRPCAATRPRRRSPRARPCRRPPRLPELARRRGAHRGPVFDAAVDADRAAATDVGAKTLFVTSGHDPHCDHEAAFAMARRGRARLAGAALGLSGLGPAPRPDERADARRTAARVPARHRGRRRRKAAGARLLRLADDAAHRRRSRRASASPTRSWRPSWATSKFHRGAPMRPQARPTPRRPAISRRSTPGDPDPWDFRTSPYERDKYRGDARGACRGRATAAALEVGCSIGVFTRRLAEPLRRRAGDRRLGQRARARPASHAATAPTRRVPPRPRFRTNSRHGPFDLIVLSEVLYYLSAADLVRVGGALQDVAPARRRRDRAVSLARRDRLSAVAGTRRRRCS